MLLKRLTAILAALAAVVLLNGCAAIQAAHDQGATVNPCETAKLPEEFGYCSVRAGTTVVHSMTNIATSSSTPASVRDALKKAVPVLAHALDVLSDQSEKVAALRKQVAAGSTPEQSLVIALGILAGAQSDVDKAVATVHSAANGSTT